MFGKSAIAELLLISGSGTTCLLSIDVELGFPGKGLFTEDSQTMVRAVSPEIVRSADGCIWSVSGRHQSRPIIDKSFLYSIAGDEEEPPRWLARSGYIRRGEIVGERPF